MAVLDLRTGRHADPGRRPARRVIIEPGVHARRHARSSAPPIEARTSGTSRRADRRDAIAHAGAGSPASCSTPAGVPARGRGDGTVSVWDPGRRTAARPPVPLGPAHNGCGANPCTVIDPRGELMATSLGDGTVALVDLRTKRLVAHAARPRRRARPRRLAFSPDGRRLATGGTAGSVTIWDVASRRRRRTACASAEPVWWTAISPDGRLLAVQRQAGAPATRSSRSASCGSGETLFSTHALRLRRRGDLAFSPTAAVRGPGCCEEGSTRDRVGRALGRRAFRATRAEHPTFALAPTRGCSSGPRRLRGSAWTPAPASARGPATKVADGRQPGRRLPGWTAAGVGRGRRERDAVGLAHAHARRRRVPVVKG